MNTMFIKIKLKNIFIFLSSKLSGIQRVQNLDFPHLYNLKFSKIFKNNLNFKHLNFNLKIKKKLIFIYALFEKNQINVEIFII